MYIHSRYKHIYSFCIYTVVLHERETQLCIYTELYTCHNEWTVCRNFAVSVWHFRGVVGSGTISNVSFVTSGILCIFCVNRLKNQSDQIYRQILKDYSLQYAQHRNGAFCRC